MPKRSRSDDCDNLEWIVDILGTVDLLEGIINGPNTNYKVKDLTLPGMRSIGAKVRRGDVPDGLYFKAGHWYCVRDGITKDSYSLDYQVRGTAHFCQTFAMFIFLGLDKEYLIPGNYGYNIKQAVSYWLRILISRTRIDINISNYIIQEIRKSKWKNNKLYGTDTELKDITKQQLIIFMKMIVEYAQAFINCKEG